jgi:hypothetical protein
MTWQQESTGNKPKIKPLTEKMNLGVAANLERAGFPSARA